MRARVLKQQKKKKKGILHSPQPHWQHNNVSVIQNQSSNISFNQTLKCESCKLAIVRSEHHVSAYAPFRDIYVSFYRTEMFEKDGIVLPLAASWDPPAAPSAPACSPAGLTCASPARPSCACSRRKEFGDTLQKHLHFGKVEWADCLGNPFPFFFCEQFVDGCVQTITSRPWTDVCVKGF